MTARSTQDSPKVREFPLLGVAVEVVENDRNSVVRLELADHAETALRNELENVERYALQAARNAQYSAENARKMLDGEPALVYELGQAVRDHADAIARFRAARETSMAVRWAVLRMGATSLRDK